MKIWNTLTQKKEDFNPIKKGTVGMYNCGPTVYNFAHIGNLRAFLFADLLRRSLELEGFTVKQVMNITDVGHLVSDNDTGEDKMEQGAKKEGKSAQELAEFYTQAFFDDLDSLNIPRTKIEFPKATSHIEEQIKLIQKLEEKGFTYATSDGIYFDTSHYKDYGKLGHVNLEGQEEGARIGVNTEKKNPTDFALWKLSKPSDKRQQEWESPWGVGFPGWHIECSAMSMKYLGETFDIHTGGIDHIPVHHNNEIAQSEGATGKSFVHYWMHSAFVNVQGGKMSKSKDNFITLETLREKGIHPLSYRYLLLQAHYRAMLNFTWESILGAQIAFENILHFLSHIQNEGVLIDSYIKQYKEYIADDINTPQVIALIHQIISDTKQTPEDKKATLYEIDTTLGLNLKKLVQEINHIPQHIETLTRERDEKRKNKDWKASDELRKTIEQEGYLVEDATEKTIIKKKLTPDM
ncbi:MAG: cysteinyl-tRNA synthetase [Candidatus Parcubacteria bacterium]|jgi:cysteinyl-tRNA synthetase